VIKKNTCFSHGKGHMTLLEIRLEAVCSCMLTEVVNDENFVGEKKKERKELNILILLKRGYDALAYR
jgi:hypothetical protein